MVDATLTDHNQKLRSRLEFLMTSGRQEPAASAACSLDVIVSYNEINARHGTGVLLQRLLAGCPDLLTIRAVDTYGGWQTFGDLSFRLPRLGMSRTEIFRTVLGWLAHASVRRVLCVPWTADEVLAAIAVKEITNADLCMYIMDDQNVSKDVIPDAIMREALVKSSLRLVVSPEMQYAYQNKYRLKFWLLPPLVDHRLLRPSPAAPAGNPHRGILVGNVWSQRWLTLLRETVRSSGIALDWYCNGGSPWLNFDKESLERDAITLHPGLPESKLAPVLAGYDFAVAPSGPLDDTDDNSCVAQLSLPSRIPFIVAAANTPVIVLGHPRTAAARFVTRFQLGAACEYSGEAFRRAVSSVIAPEAQQTMRQNAWRIAPVFSDSAAAEWLWGAMKDSGPADLRYEALFTPQPGDFVHYVDPPAPSSVYIDFHEVYQTLARLKAVGWLPDFVLDIGASTGIWSQMIKPLFPEARFLLVEPLASRYPAAVRSELARQFPDFEFVEMAVSNATGRISFKVASDLYNSSLLQVNEVSDVQEVIETDVTTLDRLAADKQITGRGLLKIDTQYAEHLVIEGGGQFIRDHVDVIAIELTLERVHPEMKTFDEMIGLLRALGFRYFDDIGTWRSPGTGMLEQKDVLFVREDLLTSAKYQASSRGTV